MICIRMAEISYLCQVSPIIFFLPQATLLFFAFFVGPELFVDGVLLQLPKATVISHVHLASDKTLTSELGLGSSPLVWRGTMDHEK